MREHCGDRRIFPLSTFPALFSLLKDLPSENQSTLLDLQAVASLTYFSDDKKDAYCLELFNALLGGLDKLHHERAYTVVLMWDICDYLCTDQIDILMASIRALCEPHAKIYCISHKDKNIPNGPFSLELLSDNLCAWTPPLLAAREAPAHSTISLLKAMKTCRVVSTQSHHIDSFPKISETVLNHQTIRRPIQNKKPTQHTNYQKHLKHHSLAVNEVANVLRSDDVSVLDLRYTATPKNDAWLNGLKNYTHLDLISASSRPGFTEGITRELGKAEAKFDLILAWDIFQFTKPAIITEFSEVVLPFCLDTTFMLAFGHCGGTKPSSPSYFEAEDSGKCTVHQVSERIPCRDSAATLTKAMSGFSLEQSFAYRKGMHSSVVDYIFSARAQDIEYFRNKNAFDGDSMPAGVA